MMLNSKLHDLKTLEMYDATPREFLRLQAFRASPTSSPVMCAMAGVDLFLLH